jgi:phosphate transport system permease protein
MSTAAPIATPDAARFRPRSWTVEGLVTVAACLVSAVSLTWLEYQRILPTTGALGFWIVTYAVFLALYATVTWLRERNRLVVVDRLFAAIAVSAGIAVTCSLALVIGYTISRGYAALHLNFFTETMFTTGPLDPLTRGGALHAMVGTLEQVGIGALIAVPLGIATAVYLNEVGGSLARVVRTLVDAMSALPSIVAGLFIFASVILTLGVDKSGLAAALALAVMMMPIVTRTAEVVLRLVPNGLREASYALGAPQWRTVLFVVLPTARSSLVTAVILGVARGVGETAPVLLTAGFTSAMNANPLEGQQVSLPLYIFNYVRFPQPDMIARAYGAALTLLLLVGILFVTARLIGGRRPGQSSRRRRKTAAVTS